jgi:hypothetical protein
MRTLIDEFRFKRDERHIIENIKEVKVCINNL